VPNDEYVESVFLVMDLYEKTLFDRVREPGFRDDKHEALRMLRVIRRPGLVV
jgi:hypothetical protein